METKSIKQTVTFSAKPQEVYNLLMDTEKHAAFTGGEAVTSIKKQGNFSSFDGYCHGYNMELVKGQKIVQAWHFDEDGWPDDHYSICTFIFEPSEKGTKLSFSQTGIPAHKVEALKDGWKKYYWNPMKTFLQK